MEISKDIASLIEKREPNNLNLEHNSGNGENIKEQEKKPLFKSENRPRIRRRKKNQGDSRSFACHLCYKSYLSYPALYTHLKNKHELVCPITKHSREKTKTDEKNEMYKPSSFDYFLHPNRKGMTIDIEDCVNEVFEQIYKTPQCDSEEMKREISDYSSAYQHNLFNKILNLGSNPHKPAADSICDEVFSYYIFSVAKCAKRECFKKFLKMLDLFREFLNKSNKNLVKTKLGIWIGVEYSEIYNAADVPEISNDFATENLKNEKGIFGLSKKEALDFIYNLCWWLYDNNYSCFKLTIMDY